jgi:hypothetical protein
LPVPDFTAKMLNTKVKTPGIEGFIDPQYSAFAFSKMIVLL